MKTYIVNSIKGLVAIALLLAIGFAGGALSHPQEAHIDTVALETTPGPYGSGTLGDWTTLSHGVYCFTNGVLTNYVVAPTGTAAQKQYAKTLSGKASAAFCPGEDIRLYGDSITFGGKSAFAAALNTKTVLVDAWSGRPTAPVADAIDAETVLPEDVIVASGTNDAFNPSVMAASVTRIKNRVAALNTANGTSTKLFWVDVQITRWGQTDVIERNDQRNGEAINYVLWNNLNKNQIIQWSGRFLQSPALLTNYLQDGVHPKVGAGYAYWAAILKGWLTTLGGI